MPFEMTKNISVTLTTAATGASTSDSFYVAHNEAVYIAPSSTLGAGETVQVQISVDGTNFYDLLDNAVTVQCSTAYSARRIQGPGLFKVQKTATASTLSVSMRK